MTTPPLPEVPCVRVRLDYTHDSGLKAGNRVYFSYPSGTPTGSDCTAFAADCAAGWAAGVAAALNPDWALTEVDVLDIATLTGLSGQWTGSHPGTASGSPAPAQTAANVEFGIARRYRGGKPRIYVPPGCFEDMLNDVQWTTTWITNVQGAISGWAAGREAFSSGALTGMQHVNISYYQGFTNVENTSGRMRAAPKYRTPTAKVDRITGYFGKQEISSQRRRRISTTF